MTNRAQSRPVLLDTMGKAVATCDSNSRYRELIARLRCCKGSASA